MQQLKDDKQQIKTWFLFVARWKPDDIDVFEQLFDINLYINTRWRLLR